ncbi:MAG: hypothetical protein RIS90_2948 [Pseudomonadota bacterium]|jgi:hypothetical protein
MKVRPYADAEVAQVLGYHRDDVLSLGKRLIPDH